MCDDRERLIGYVYDECDERERRTIETHLDECPECRLEIGGFRRVRQDLLAWDVPEHGSVWRPFAPVRTTAWWREVPAWAMAAAALAVFAVGAGGGVVTHALVPDDPAAPVVVTAAAPARGQLTAAEMAAFEAHVLSLVRTEMATRTSAPGVERVAMSAEERASFEAEILRRVFDIHDRTAARYDQTWGMLAADFSRQTARLNALSRDVESMQAAMQNPSFQGR